MEGMNWLCVHCGTPIPDHGDKCPNCEEDPYKLEPGELQDVSLRDFWKFVRTGKLKSIGNQQ